MGIDQLRTAFLLSGAAHDRLQKMRAAMLDSIRESQARSYLQDGPILAIQMLLFESLDGDRNIDLDIARQRARYLNPIGTTGKPI